MKVTIPEGYEIYKIADTLEDKGLIDKDKFYYLIDYGDFDYAFVKNIPQRDNRLEGICFRTPMNLYQGMNMVLSMKCWRNLKRHIRNTKVA